MVVGVIDDLGGAIAPSVVGVDTGRSLARLMTRG